MGAPSFTALKQQFFVIVLGCHSSDPMSWHGAECLQDPSDPIRDQQSYGIMLRLRSI